MKTKFTLFILSIFVLSSCTNIMFETSMPKDVRVMSKFPRKVVGSYYDGKKDTLVITKKTFTYGKSKNSMLISGSLDKDEAELKKLNSFYYLNLKKSDGYWTVFPFQLTDEGLDVYYILMEELIDRLDTSKTTQERENEIISAISYITAVYPMTKPDSKDKEYLVSPTNEEFEELMKQGYFVKIGGFKRLK